MGSCCSTRASSDEPNQKLDGDSISMAARRSRSRPSLESRAPPPDDEAVVKEVLSVSETPKLRLRDEEPKLDSRFLGLDQRSEAEKKEEIISEFAEEEICSVTESLSTTNATNDFEDEAPNHSARVWNNHHHRSPMKPANQRSLSGEIAANGRRERAGGFGGKSPSRRAESSPGRRFGNGHGQVRIVQPRTADSGRVGPVRRGESLRRDSSEGSARRSRSPGIRSGGARRSARSPGRVDGVLEDPSWSAKKKCVDDGVNDESLDNPLVSLECFIFL